jgi:hypothetical protein
MAVAAGLDGLTAPTSVLKIASFLIDVRGRLKLGGSANVADAWDRHNITSSHVDGFLRWLHVDRKEKTPPELELPKKPDKTLAKPATKEPEGSGSSKTERETQEQAAEAAMNVHLWSTLFKPETRLRERQGRPNLRTGVAVGDRAGNFANGYNRNFMLSTLALGSPEETYQSPESGGLDFPASANTSELGDAKESPPQAQQKQHLTNGMAANAFGSKVAAKNEAGLPSWNEPVRRNVLPTFGFPESKLGAPPPMEDSVRAPVADPLFGQITLVAPPLTVAGGSDGPNAMGLTFDWRDMAKGAGVVDYSGLASIAKTLPEGSQALYPAVDPRKLRGGAVNLRLDPKVIAGLTASGYGPDARVDAFKSARMAQDWHGGTPPSRLLPAKLSPLDRPGRRRSGMSADALPQGAGDAPSDDPARRMRFLKFLGLPIYLSPNFNVAPDMEQESRARITAEFMPRAPIISPLSFHNLRSSFLGGFHGVEAKPELGVWRRAAPDYERAGSMISNMLTNRIRSGGLADAAVSTASGPRSAAAALPTFAGPARNLGASTVPTISGAAMGMRAPLRPSQFSPPSMPSPGVGSAPQADVPRFIRHEPRAPGIAPTHGPTPFRPTIPAAPTPSSTAPSGQSRTAPQGAGASSRGTTLSPQITIAPEKTSPRSRSAPAKQAMASPTPASQPAPMEGPKPSRTAAPATTFGPRTTAPTPDSRPKQTPRSDEPRPLVEPQSGPGNSLRPPRMAIAPNRPMPGPTTKDEPLAIQASTATPSGAASESAATRSAEVAEKKESGLPGSEINLLANEVWILLKRRLSFEAQRMGK